MVAKGSKINIRRKSIIGLLRDHSTILDELKRRKVVRTKNNPVGGYAEWLVSKKFKLKLEPNSNVGYDATDRKGIKYEIKGRRVTIDNPSTQLSVIRGLKLKHFEYLIGVIFDENYNVRYAAKIPHSVVVELSTYRKSVNGHIMHLQPTILKNKRVKDITKKLTS